MNSDYAHEQHEFHHSHQLFSSKKSLRDIDIPPRKLLSRRAVQESADMYSDSPRFSSADETLLQKYLPYNTGHDSDDDSDPYSSDRFRMYEFKIRRCTRSRSHDWTECPFAHPGEKARRRDPTIYRYSGTVCPEYRRGGCSCGDSCEFAHGVFESWLHPSRYRTEACRDGKNCKRKVCFFAHTPRQLRIVSENCNDSLAEMSCKKKLNSCLFCHCGGQGAAAASPTSTLLGMSHLSPPLSPSQSISPPLSPIKARNASVSGFPPISRYSERFGGSESSSLMNPHHGHGMMSYKDVLTELMSSLKAVKFSEALPASPMPSNKALTLPWVDVSFNCDDQQQFIISPSTTASASVSANSYNRNYFNTKVDDNKVSIDSGKSCPTPDLGWVNSLLM